MTPSQPAFLTRRLRLTQVGASALIAIAASCPGIVFSADSAASGAAGAVTGSVVPPAVLRAWGNVSAALEGQLSKARSGRVTAQEPQQSAGAIETWGDEAAPSTVRPSRQPKSGERRSAATSGRVPQEDLELDSSMQTRDVHYGRRALDKPRMDTDDRLRDERGIGDRRSRQARSTGPGKEDAFGLSEAEGQPSSLQDGGADSRAVRGLRASRARAGLAPASGAAATTGPRFSGSDSPGASCSNPVRTWQGAQALAERGQAQAAYRAYLGLLSTCVRKAELEGTAWKAGANLSAAALADLIDEPVLASPALASSLVVLRTQLLFAANEAGDSAKALELSRALRPELLRSRSAPALEVSGWLEQQARQHRQAEQLFRAALKVERDNMSARQGLVLSQLAQGRLDAAEQEARTLDGEAAQDIRAQLSYAKARQALSDGRASQALQLLDQAAKEGLEASDDVLEVRAWALKNAGQAKAAQALFARLSERAPESATLSQGLVASAQQAGDVAALRALSKEAPESVADAARLALAQRLRSTGEEVAARRLDAQASAGSVTSAGAELGARLKSGDAGQAKLLQVDLPSVALQAPLGESSLLQARASASRLSDGVSQAQVSRFELGLSTRINDVVASGWLGASRAPVGTAPIGSLSLRMPLTDGHVQLEVARDEVRDSARSWAGVTEFLTDSKGAVKGTRSVGRALDTYARLSGAVPAEIADTVMRVDWQVRAGTVEAQNVAANGYYQALMALSRDWQSDGWSWLNAGPYVSLGSYERDENRFGVGNGGYFSPKSDTGLGLQGAALSLEGARSLWRVSGKMGFVSRSSQAGVDSGLAVEGRVQTSWLMSPNLVLGAGLGVKVAPGSSELGLRVGVVMPLEPRYRLFGSDLVQMP